MDTSYKPDDYTTVSPYLVVDGASATIDFLKRVLGAVEIRRFPDAAGKLMHAEVRIDDSVLMIADGGDGWPPVPSSVHVGCDVPVGPRGRSDLGAGTSEEG